MDKEVPCFNSKERMCEEENYPTCLAEKKLKKVIFKTAVITKKQQQTNNRNRHNNVLSCEHRDHNTRR